MSAANRLHLVSSLFALMTHQIAVLRYQGAWAWKKRQARLLARNCPSNEAPSLAVFLCS